MLSKKAIEKAKDDLMFFNEGDWITREMDRSADVLEEYIAQLEQENNKLNKIIDEIIKEYATCKTCLNYTCKKRDKNAKECIKQYFEKKVEEK